MRKLGKKLISALMVAVMVIPLAGCKSEKADATTVASTEAEAEKGITAAEETAES